MGCRAGLAGGHVARGRSVRARRGEHLGAGVRGTPLPSRADRRRDALAGAFRGSDHRIRAAAAREPRAHLPRDDLLRRVPVALRRTGAASAVELRRGRGEDRPVDLVPSGAGRRRAARHDQLVRPREADHVAEAPREDTPRSPGRRSHHRADADAGRASGVVNAFIHHAGLAAAVGALAAAGWRVGPGSGLARLVAAVVLAAAAAVAEALLLGLFGVGGSSVALVAAAGVTWAVARAFVPARGLSPWGELLAWARGLDRVAAFLFGSFAGAACAWTAWLFLHPALGHDMVLYHLPEAIQWVHGGQPGAVDKVISSVPVGSYPLTHEVLLEWGLAIGRSFVWAVLVTALMPVLFVAAGWLGLRALGIDRIVRAVAVAAIVATPAVLASQSGGASLDPAALAWLVSCGALCACAVAQRDPALVAPAVVAAGLAIGTKTTAAPLSLTVLVAAAWLLRRALARAARPL